MEQSLTERIVLSAELSGIPRSLWGTSMSDVNFTLQRLWFLAARFGVTCAFFVAAAAIAKYGL